MFDGKIARIHLHKTFLFLVSRNILISSFLHHHRAPPNAETPKHKNKNQSGLAATPLHQKDRDKEHSILLKYTQRKPYHVPRQHRPHLPARTLPPNHRHKALHPKTLHGRRRGRTTHLPFYGGWIIRGASEARGVGNRDIYYLCFIDSSSRYGYGACSGYDHQDCEFDVFVYDESFLIGMIVY